MKAHGEITAKIASQISAEWEARGYDVLYDHGSQKESDSVGKIVSWFGDGKTYKRETELSQLDIAIVKKGSNDVFALIEIEETTDRPKTLIGDIFGILMGEHISFGKDRELRLGKDTMLIVLGQSQVRHAGRNQYMEDEAMKMKSHLSTGNGGRVRDLTPVPPALRMRVSERRGVPAGGIDSLPTWGHRTRSEAEW